MSDDASSKVTSRLADLVSMANRTVIPQKRVPDGNDPIASENNRVVNDFLESFNRAEEARSNREKPLLRALIALTSIQVIAFNVIIAGTGIYLFRLGDTSVLPLFFDILKYYIGATVVELIGIFAFIIKGTFTSDHSKLMKTLLSKKPTE